MAEKAKTITSSVNLPTSDLFTIVNVDDRRFEVPINEVIEDFNEKKVEFIKTMNTTVIVDEVTEMSKYVKPEYIHMNHNISYINNIEKRIINEENKKYLKENIKFYNISLEFYTGKVMNLTVPSYVKFYSMHKGVFLPVEQLKNRDILMEIGGRMVKVSDAELATDYEITNEYYNIKVTFDRQYDEDEGIKEYPNLYLNGILANIAYMNFNKSFDEVKEK